MPETRIPAGRYRINFVRMMAELEYLDDEDRPFRRVWTSPDDIGRGDNGFEKTIREILEASNLSPEPGEVEEDGGNQPSE